MENEKPAMMTMRLPIMLYFPISTKETVLFPYRNYHTNLQISINYFKLQVTINKKNSVFSQMVFPKGN